MLFLLRVISKIFTYTTALPLSHAYILQRILRSIMRFDCVACGLTGKLAL